MKPYLLPLSTLNAAAPGVLDVVFGPDGDFEGAPFWAGPVTEIGRYCNHGACRWVATVGRQVHTIEITPSLELDDVALDLRVSSVAARLAGLCGRVLLTTDPDESARLVRVALNASMHPLNEGEATALAALTLALAPRIVKLVRSS